MMITTQVATVHSIRLGDYLRVMARTIRPSTEPEGWWDIDLEVQRIPETDQRRIQWLMAGGEDMTEQDVPEQEPTEEPGDEGEEDNDEETPEKQDQQTG